MDIELGWEEEAYETLKLWESKLDTLMTKKLGYTGRLHDDPNDRLWNFLDYIREEYVIPTYQANVVNSSPRRIRHSVPLFGEQGQRSTRGAF